MKQTYEPIRFKSTFLALPVLLMAVVATAACSSDDDSLDDQQPLVDAPKQTTVIMTVEATKASGDAATRALSLSDDGKTLYGKWEEDEQAWVYKKDKRDDWEIIGHLSPTNISADGLRCTLTGSFDAFHIDGADGLEAGDMLKLELGNDVEPMFIQQDGSLQLISENYDYNLAMVTVGQVSTATAGGETVYSVTTTGPATFEPQVAIVRFNLQNKAGRPITASHINFSLLPSDGKRTTTAKT
ncbi:MAG: hypothetical protein IJ892_11530 [Prevotella sp.]|nr:hypothetical protein [Prevotella sp.]